MTNPATTTPTSTGLAPNVAAALSYVLGPITGVLFLVLEKQNRFVRLPTAATLRAPAVDALLRAAEAQAKVPMPTSGRIRTVVKSISAKQRPRRASRGA